jgi:hypothetical protein
MPRMSNREPGSILMKGDISPVMYPILNAPIIPGQSQHSIRARHRLEFRLERSKAIVAIARHLLVAVWHILKSETVDRHADVISLAASMLQLAYQIKKRNLPRGVSGSASAREQLDRLGIGQDLTAVPSGKKKLNLPLSRLLLQKKSERRPKQDLLLTFRKETAKGFSGSLLDSIIRRGSRKRSHGCEAVGESCQDPISMRNIPIPSNPS